MRCVPPRAVESLDAARRWRKLGVQQGECQVEKGDGCWEGAWCGERKQRKACADRGRGRGRLLAAALASAFLRALAREASEAEEECAEVERALERSLWRTERCVAR